MVIRTTNKFSPLARQERSGLACLLGVAMLAMGCNAAKKAPEADPAPPAASAAASPAVAPPEEEKSPTPLPRFIPTKGPQLVVIPGKGFGPIRFGATVETVERHMGAPCDQKTETRCVYFRQAAEFTFKDGVVAGMKAHISDRAIDGRPPAADKAYGSFNGAIPPQIMLGLHRHIVLEEFGEPERKEPAQNPPELGLVDRHIYDGVIFEYDKIKNGNIVLAGIEITPSTTALPNGPKNVAGATAPAGAAKTVAPIKPPAPLKAKGPPPVVP